MEKLPNILVVDDDNELLENLIDLLELSNFRVHGVASAFEGLKYAINEKPDLVISDIYMPGMDGYEFIEKLREYHLTKDIPIILLTAKRFKTEEDSIALSSKITYMIKPFHNSELIKTVEKILCS